jgi:hypothetical protein
MRVGESPVLYPSRQAAQGGSQILLIFEFP